MSAETYPDIPRLRKAVEWVETQATLPDEQCEWHQEYWRSSAVELDRTCGTCYCVAGKVCDDAGLAWVNPAAVVYDNRTQHVATVAISILGITGIEADRLFDGDNTAADVRYHAESIAARVGERL